MESPPGGIDRIYRKYGPLSNGRPGFGLYFPHMIAYLRTLTRTQKLELLGAGVLILSILALTLWYMATHKSPEPYTPFETATSTPPTLEPQTVEEHTQYYDIEAVYPAETPLLDSAGEAADRAAIETMRKFIDTIAGDFKREGGFDSITKEDLELLGYTDGRRQALSIEYDEAGSPHTVSYNYSIYLDTFGAHPNTFYRTFTFDLKTGKELALKDLFAPKAPYLKRLSDISRFELSKELGPDADMEYLNQGTTPEAVNFENFVIDGDALTIIFPPYQVGPYALGPQAVSIPLENLKDILRPAYLP